MIYLPLCSSSKGITLCISTSVTYFVSENIIPFLDVFLNIFNSFEKSPNLSIISSQF